MCCLIAFMLSFFSVLLNISEITGWFKGVFIIIMILLVWVGYIVEERQYDKIKNLEEELSSMKDKISSLEEHNKK